MTEAIITVESLGKKYSLRHQPNKRHRALRDVLTDRAKNLFFRPRETSNGTGYFRG